MPNYWFGEGNEEGPQENSSDHRLHFLKYTHELGVNDLVRYGAGQYVVDFQYSFVLKYSLHSRSYALGV